MNVLYVSHYYPPFSVGGVEEHTRTLARDVVAAGHSAHVFHGVIGQGLDDYRVLTHEVDGIPCTGVSVDLNTIDDFSGTWRQAEVERILARLLLERSFDVAHVMHLTRLSTGIADLLRERGIPTVLTLHDYWMQCARGQRVRPDGGTCHDIDLDRCAQCMAPDIEFLDGRKSAWGRVLARARRAGPRRTTAHRGRIEERRRDMQAVLEEVDLVVTPSEFTRETFRSWGVRREILVEPLGIDLALAQGYRETSAPELRFGFLGRLMPTKGLEVLIDAFLEPDVAADLVVHGFGDAPYDASLRARAAANPRIRFAGPFEQSELARVYSTFDVQVVPSTWLECSPLVVHTARLFRKPLVVSSIGGLIEMVRDGVDGLRFHPGDARDLAARVRTLAADPELVARLQAALPAPRSSQDYAAALERHYERLAASSWTSRSRS